MLETKKRETKTERPVAQLSIAPKSIQKKRLTGLPELIFFLSDIIAVHSQSELDISSGSQNLKQQMNLMLAMFPFNTVTSSLFSELAG
ncbi:MAG: hypothetical protein EBQ63_00910 [Actinobacteria bacterium]|nr:hypothetical protein [Actinomycetota bacterium]